MRIQLRLPMLHRQTRKRRRQHLPSPTGRRAYRAGHTATFRYSLTRAIGWLATALTPDLSAMQQGHLTGGSTSSSSDRRPILQPTPPAPIGPDGMRADQLTFGTGKNTNSITIATLQPTPPAPIGPDGMRADQLIFGTGTNTNPITIAILQPTPRRL